MAAKADEYPRQLVHIDTGEKRTVFDNEDLVYARWDGFKEPDELKSIKEADRNAAKAEKAADK